MPIKAWGVGDELLASDLNTYLSDQVVSTFANVAARNAAIPSPEQGQVSAVGTTRGLLWVYDGSDWIAHAPMRATALHAAPPTVAVGADLLVPFIQSGHNVQLTDASHQGIIVFPEPFAAPPGIIHIQDMTGTASVQYQFGIDWSTVTIGQFVFVVRDHLGAAVASSSVRCSWTAIGNRS